MRKMKKFMAGALASMMLLSVAACGKAEEVGKYAIYELNADGVKMSADDLKKLGMGDAFKLELKDDGTGVMTMDGEEEKFEWKDGKITAGDDTMEYEYKDGKLTLKDGEDEMVYKKE